MAVSLKARKFISKSIIKFYDRKYISPRTKEADKGLLRHSPSRFNRKATAVAFKEARARGYKVPASLSPYSRQKYR